MESFFNETHTFIKYISKNKNLKNTINDIINSGVDINLLDDQKRTALHMACIHKSEEGITNLLIRGADIHIIDNYGYNAFLYSIIHCNTKSISDLLNFGSDINFISHDEKKHNALTISILNNNKIILNFLLLKGADPNILISKNRNALLYACNKGNEYCSLKLLKYIKNINHIDSSKSNAAHHAVDYCSTKVLEELINKNINLFQKDCQDETPIHLCIKNNKIKSFFTILNKLNFNDIKSLEYNGSNLLHYAAFHNSDNIIELLIKKGFKVNSLNKMKESALSLSIRYNNIKSIKKLLELNARTEKGMYNGLNPIFLSTKYNYEIFNLITESYDNNSLIKMGTGDKLIHSVCYYDNLNILKILIDKGSDINQKNHINLSPIGICLISESFGCINHLIQFNNLELDIQEKGLSTSISWICCHLEYNYTNNKIDNILKYLISIKKINSPFEKFNKIFKNIYDILNLKFNKMRNDKNFKMLEENYNMIDRSKKKCYHICNCCNKIIYND